MRPTPVDSHPGLQRYRMARSVSRVRAAKRKAILEQNPSIAPNMLERIVDAQIKLDTVRS